jgi:beta-carotene 3-hydroxylase
MIWTAPLFWVIVAVVAVFMEFWAMLLHGRLWHGPMWFTHRSHHTARQGWFEFNDIFAVFHAAIAIALIIGGLEGLSGTAQLVAVAAGIGMTVFGMAYFAVHDGLIHGRLPVAFLARLEWIRRIRNAHQVHHVKDAQPYGLFLGPWELKRVRVRNRRA